MNTTGNLALTVDPTGTFNEYAAFEKAQRESRANRIARELASNPDGYTIDGRLDAPQKGCAVAIAESLVVETVDVDEIADYVAGHASGPYWGIWRDSETGLVYVDTVDVMPTEKAIEIAKARGEIAVWDFEKGEIRVNGDVDESPIR